MLGRFCNSFNCLFYHQKHLGGPSINASWIKMASMQKLNHITTFFKPRCISKKWKVNTELHVLLIIMPCSKYCESIGKFQPQTNSIARALRIKTWVPFCPTTICTGETTSFCAGCTVIWKFWWGEGKGQKSTLYWVHLIHQPCTRCIQYIVSLRFCLRHFSIVFWGKWKNIFLLK